MTKGAYSHKIDRKAKYKREDPVAQIHEYNIDIECNIIYLQGEESYVLTENEEIMETGEPGIEYTMANRFIRNLGILMRKSADPILVKMKTNGGYWSEGMAIHNMIQACPNPITILNITHARSMSSLIFQAANKRVMMPDSIFMFHEGEQSHSGTWKQFESDYFQGKLTRERMLEIYIDSMKRKGRYKNKSRKYIYGLLEEQMNRKEDVYLDARQTVEWGLADEIFGGDGSYDWSRLTKYEKEQLEGK